MPFLRGCWLSPSTWGAAPKPKSIRAGSGRRGALEVSETAPAATRSVEARSAPERTLRKVLLAVHRRPPIGSRGFPIQEPLLTNDDPDLQVRTTAQTRREFIHTAENSSGRTSGSGCRCLLRRPPWSAENRRPHGSVTPEHLGPPVSTPAGSMRVTERLRPSGSCRSRALCNASTRCEYRAGERSQQRRAAGHAEAQSMRSRLGIR